jgi:hypothetical protein
MQGAISEAILSGDLKMLSPELRVLYYNAVCKSIGLNPATKPFDFMDFDARAEYKNAEGKLVPAKEGKLILYPGKNCAEQLRSLRGISLSGPKITYDGSLIFVEITATDRSGRTDTDFGIVDTASGKNKSLSRADAILKAITKAKRRVTFSISGFGYLDDAANQIDSGEAVLLDPGEFVEPPKAIAHGQDYMSREDLKLLGEAAKAAGLKESAYKLYLRSEFPNRSQSEFEKDRMDKILCDFEDSSIVQYWNDKANPPGID